MDITRIFSAVTNDPQAVSKLAITALITLFAIIFTPLLIGLAGWAVLLGYQVALMGNMRAGMLSPLPRWDDISEYFRTGSQVLIAAIIYALPVVLLGVCAGTLPLLGGEDFAGAAAGLVLCCLTPLLLVYGLIALPMFTLAMGRFTEDPRLGVFFRFGDLFRTLRERRNTTIGFLVGAALLSLIFTILGAIPCIGWLATAALTVPLNGALGGQFVTEIMGGRGKRGGF